MNGKVHVLLLYKIELFFTALVLSENKCHFRVTMV